MKFALHYDGPLPSAGNKPKKAAVWRIRKHFHPQLVDLWASHPALIELSENTQFPVSGGALIQRHHSNPGPITPPFLLNHALLNSQGIIELCEPIDKNGIKFLPLVRESFALHAGINIHFLRKEAPGSVYQGGDLDGRIKTLIDALTMPQHPENMIKDPACPPITYCLLENDHMISGINVESERLLNATTEDKSYVRLTIEVDVRVRQAMIYNQSFLG